MISHSRPLETSKKGGWEYHNSTLKIGCYKLIHGNSEHVVK